MRRGLAAGTGAYALLCAMPGLAQSVTAHSSPSPWSLTDAIAPEGLTLSASTRLRLETIDGQPKTGFNQGDTTVSLRTSVFAEYRSGEVRIGGELLDSRVWNANRKSPVTSNDVNALEPVQAYAALDLAAPFGKESKATLKAGRFVLNLGSRRLVAADDYRNTTNGYTGVHADIAFGAGIRANLIYVLPQTRLPADLASVLDARAALDRESFDAVLWGGLLTRNRGAGRVSVEAGFFHFGERDRAGLPTRDRSLDTAGGRVFREAAPGRVDFEVEAYRQWGKASAGTGVTAQLPVSAWMLHADVGHSFAGAWKPRVSLRFDYVSGDRPGGRYNRFDTLFGMRRAELAPAGLYNAVGRANLLSPGIRVEAVPGKRSDGFLAYRALWLASATDSFSTTGVRDARGRSGRFAGHQFEARVRHWLVPNALRLEGNALYLAKGRFLERAPNAPRNGDTLYTSLNLMAFF